MNEDSFDKIKKLIKVIGGKVIIVEDGNPTFVIIDVDEYVNYSEIKNHFINETSKSKKIVEERINKDINVWKSMQDERKIKQFESENIRKDSNKNEINNDAINDITIESL
ncbi:MAG: hypothetical protein P1P85_00355 [Patescibacteria group bacterium]|nr:hypothetical protein [Patescibacteria group bacterium]